MLEEHARIDRRLVVQAIGAGALAFALPFPAIANPFADQPLHPRAKILRQTNLTVPGTKPGSPPGVAGADVSVQARGILGVDWVISGNDVVTLLLLTGGQKTQLMSGQQVSGDPLMRLEIEGPETAGHSVNVRPGNYYVAFLNSSAQTANLLYRTSLVPY